MKKIIGASIFLGLCVGLYGSWPPPSLEWRKFYESDVVSPYDSSRSIHFSDMDYTEDGNIIIGGGIYIRETRMQRKWVFMLMKVDMEGNEIWRKYYYKDEYGSWLFGGVSSAVGGGYYIAATHRGSERQGWLMKVNEDGEEEWDCYIDSEGVNINDIISSGDGGCILTGGIGGKPGVIKVSSSGDEEWRKRIDIAEEYEFSSVERGVREGDKYIIVGYAGYDDYPLHYYYSFIFEISDDGEIRRYRKYRDEDVFPFIRPEFRSICRAYDGGYMIGGYVGESGKGLKGFLFKVDSGFNPEVYDTVYGYKDYYINVVRGTRDSGYIVAYSWFPRSDIVKIDRECRRIWKYDFSGEGSDSIYYSTYLNIKDILVTEDNEYIAGGNVSLKDDDPKNSGGWLGKVGPDMGIEERKVDKIEDKMYIIGGDKLILRGCGYGVVRIYDIRGRLVLSEEIDSSSKYIDIGHLSRGVYFVEMKAGGYERRDKVIIMR